MAALNPDKVTVIHALGQTYQLYFGMKALRGFEVETDKSIMAVFSSGDITLDTLAVLIRHGLTQAHPEISDDDVNALIDETGIKETLDLALTALEKSLPKPNVRNGVSPDPLVAAP